MAADQPSLFDFDVPAEPVRTENTSTETTSAETAPFDMPVEVASSEAPAAGSGKEKLYLADALALAYRAHFAFIQRPLVNSKGMNTSSVYGFASALLKLLEDEQPDHIAVCFDMLGGKPNFRDVLYEQYKAHRPPMPDGIRDGIPYIKRLVEAFDIPVVEVEGVEADDVIGTLATRASLEGVETVIVSPDKDFRQLLSDCVSIFRPAYKGESFDRETDETFRERYGLEPIQFIDVLALLGDTADNVPGVPGIGEKTAPALIQEYGSVENLLEHAEGIKAKRVREGLLEHRETALLSKRLVTIDTAVPFDLDWHRLKRTAPNVEAIQAIFDEMEFGGRLRSRVEAYAAGKRARPRGFTTVSEDDPDLAFDFGPYTPVTNMEESDADYTTALAQEDVQPIATKMGGPVLSFDTETTSVDALMASLVGVSLAVKEKEAAYVPTPMPDGTSTDAVLEVLRPLLEDESTLKVGHNLKYDLLVMGRHGVDVKGPIFDTMIAHYLINPEASHKLDDVSGYFLNYRPQPITELIGTGKNALSMRDVPIEQVGPYACEDADVALRLKPILEEKLKADGLDRIAEEIEFPLVRVLADMERAGVKIDLDILGEIRVSLDAEILNAEAAIYEAAGREFGIGSTKQLADVLFNPPPTDEEKAAAQQWAADMADPAASGKTKKQLAEEAPTYGIGLKPLSKTATGKPSTDERVLSDLAVEHALPALVLDWRKLTKLKGTYVDALPQLVNPETGRVHTDFNQAVAATGRLSSSNPGLQNIPIRSERGREIRKAFVAEKGCVLLSADYAQIELRIIAHLSKDEALIEAFQSGLDIHTATAAAVFGVEPGEVSRTMRDRVKQVNYGIPYGISAFGLGQRLRIPAKDAQVLIDQYRASYPRVLEYLDSLVEVARKTGYVETLLGRRRYVPLITARNPNERSAAERIAVNMPIQGTQADMIKKAMVAIHDRLAREGLKARLTLQVHDELVLEVPEEEVETVRALVIAEMEAAIPLIVPIVVEAGVGPNWLDAH